MEFAHIIRKLRQEREKLDEVIKSLRDLQVRQAAQAAIPNAPPKRRGRKSMGANERQEVSRRMKKYWASRREAKQLKK